MWQRFTERARKVVYCAQEEAQLFGGGYISTEHILLALCRDSDTVAARVLERCGVSLDRIRVEVEKQLPRGDARPSRDMTLTPRAKRVIDLGYEEARDLNNNYIGTEHLLLGLVRESDGLAARVLSKLGVELDRVRLAVIGIQDDDTKRRGATPPDRTPPPPRPYYPYSFLMGRHIAAHLVLASVGDPETVTGRAIRAVVKDVESLQGELWLSILNQSNRGILPPEGGELEEILLLAHGEAAAMAHDRIEPFHLLLAVAQADRTPTGRVLRSAGANPAQLREAVLAALASDR